MGQDNSNQLLLELQEPRATSMVTYSDCDDFYLGPDVYRHFKSERSLHTRLFSEQCHDAPGLQFSMNSRSIQSLLNAINVGQTLNE